MTRNRIAVDMIDTKKNKTLAMPYPSMLRAVHKQATPTSEAVVVKSKIKITARKLCRRNNVLNEK